MNTTKIALEASLKELLKKKPFDKITIADLTEDCGISRMAFYYHFKDIYDLVEWACVEDGKKALRDKKTYDTWQEGFAQIFEAVLENKPFIMNVYHSVRREKIESFLYKLTYQLIADVVEFDEKDTLLSEIVSEAADNVMALCDLRDIRLSIDEGSDKDACIHADAYWQCEAITNIVKNAVEHAESEVKIGFYRYEMYAEITVQNDGETISDEDKKHIFTRFYSGSGQPADSIGIGLSLAEAIVRHDNGYILVEDCKKDVLQWHTLCGKIFVIS